MRTVDFYTARLLPFRQYLHHVEAAMLTKNRIASTAKWLVRLMLNLASIPADAICVLARLINNSGNEQYYSNDG
jgi:hypothetical protein